VSATKGKYERKSNRQVTMDLKDAPCRAAMDSQRLVQRPIERGAVIAELLPQLLFRLSVGKVGRLKGPCDA
jgi:hypothetical protein